MSIAATQSLPIVSAPLGPVAMDASVLPYERWLVNTTQK